MKNKRIKITFLLLLVGLFFYLFPSNIHAINLGFFKKIQSKPPITTTRKKYINNKLKNTGLKNLDVKRVRKFRTQVKKGIRKWNELSKQEKEKRLTKIKRFLIKNIERATTHLEHWRNHIQKMKVINKEDKDSSLKEIDKDIKWLNNEKSKVSDIENAEDLMKTAKEVREYWSNSHAKIKKFIGLILVGRTRYVLSRVELVYQKLQNIVSTAEREGKDVSNAKNLLKKAGEDIALAKENITAARNMFNSISTRTNAQQYFREGVKKLQTVYKYLKDFRINANKAWKEVHSLRDEKH